MKDKMKGLLLGLTLGTLVTGSLAYATNSTSIDVYFRELKYVFDGVEKPSGDAPGFIYNDTAYVPVRYMAQAIGKEVNFDNDTGTVWIGKNYGGDGKTPVATYKGGQVTQVELDTFMAANTFYGQRGMDKQAALKQLIGLKVLAGRNDEAASAEAAKTADAQYAQVLQYFGSSDALNGQLKQLQLNDHDLREYIKLNTLAQATLRGMADDAAVQAEYDKERKADPYAFVTASVRHILIATNAGASGGTQRTDEEALARAKEVEAKLAAGEDFAALAKTYSDDPGSKDKGGLYESAEVTSYVEEFKKAAAEQPVGVIGEPVKTSYGYHIIKVESRETKTVDQVKDSLKQRLVGATFQTFQASELPGLIESINLPDPKPQPSAPPAGAPSATPAP